MLEIVALWFLCKKMGEKLRAKGWTRTWWMQTLVVLAWFGSMFVGSVVYIIYISVTQGEAAVEELGLILYLVAIVSGAVGVGLLFLIASLLPTQGQPAPQTEGPPPAVRPLTLQSPPGREVKRPPRWKA